MHEQLTGPAVNVAYKDGQPTPAAQNFAKKAGVDLSQLEKVTTPKGEYLSAKVTKKGEKDQRDPRGVPAQRNQLHLLAKEHVLAQARRSFRPSGALAGCDA